MAKEYGTQYAPSIYFKRDKGVLKNAIVGTLLMDLSEGYDCVNHELVIAKLVAYGLSD